MLLCRGVVLFMWKGVMLIMLIYNVECVVVFVEIVDMFEI